MTAPVLEAREGRPPTTRAGLERRVAWERERNLNLRLELLAQRDENLAFANRVRIGVDRIVTAAAAGARHVVVNEAGRLGYEANRARVRLSSVVL